MQFFLCLGSITVTCSNVSCTTWFNLIRNLFSTSFGKCFHHVKYGISVSCSKIIYRNSCFLFQFLYCTDMSDCKIDYVNVIADTCSVRCIIIISKHTEALKFTDCDLCNVWDQVVRDSLRIFSDQSALMSSDWVEVTKKYDVPLRICCMKICQDLLQHPFCPSVWICTCSLRALFCDRDKCRITIYCCRRTENDILHAVISHYITEN